MDEEEYVKQKLQRKAKALKRATGMKYTEALRYVTEDEAKNPEIASKTWDQIKADVDVIAAYMNGE